MSDKSLCEVSTLSFLLPNKHTPSPPHYPKLKSQEALIYRFGGDGAGPQNTTFLDFYMLDGKGSRLSQLNSMNLGMLPKVGKPLVLIKLPNLISKYWTPFFQVDKSTGNLDAMDLNSREDDNYASGK